MRFYDFAQDERGWYLKAEEDTYLRYLGKPGCSVNHISYSLKVEGDADSPNHVRLLSMKQVLHKPPSPKHHTVKISIFKNT